MALRLVFMGTPDFAVPTLLELAGSGQEIAAVYTRAPQPAGRGLGTRASAVAREAERFGLPIFTPKTLRDTDAVAVMRKHGADAAVVVAYGLILPQPILDAFPLGCFNLHASLLPRWRGAAPIQRAVMAGDRETGVMVMQMEAGLDTGPIAMAERVAIGADATAGELHDDAGAPRRQAHGCRACRAGARHAAIDAAIGRRRDLRDQDREGRDAHRLDASRRRKSTTIAVDCRPFPAPGSKWPALDASRFCTRPREPAAASRDRCSTIN